MKKTIIRQYAKLIAVKGVNIQKGQEVMIHASVENPEFVKMLVEECYRAGAGKVIVEWSFQPLAKLHYRYRSLKTLSKLEDWEVSRLEHRATTLPAMIYIESDDPDAFDAPMDGDICFEHVNFAYENSPELLHDINFTMKAGTTLGILGGTGSGKSTLMLLLDKLYPLPENGGSITIGGTDIRKIKTSHLRQNIGMVLQEPFLFSRTLAENIAIVSPELDMEAVRSAAAAAALDETIQSFASGYETMVGERGVTLSGGQKQRAAIARMLTQDVPIMIFDDSLSAVDTETDAKIRKAISQRFGKASVILISHRITTLSAADKIIVLDRGRIVEEGTHEELKNGGGIYQKIYETQSGSQEVSE